MNAPHSSGNGGDNCCNPKTGPRAAGGAGSGEKSGSASLVAVGAAILSSGCCWLPLALLGLGVSAAGLSKFIVGARWIFIAIAVVALGTGFYMSYRRTAVCAPCEVCAPSVLARFNRVMLWASAALVLAFATFPYYSALLLQTMGAGGNNALVNSSPPTKTVDNAPSATTMAANTTGATMTQFRLYTYQIKGMVCQECADGLQAAASFDPQSVAKRISGIGYKTTLVNPKSTAATKSCCP